MSKYRAPTRPYQEDEPITDGLTIRIGTKLKAAMGQAATARGMTASKFCRRAIAHELGWRALGVSLADQRCQCGAPVNHDAPGCAWHEARHVAELTAALKRIDWQVGHEQGSQWLAGQLVDQGIRVVLS